MVTSHAAITCLNCSRSLGEIVIADGQPALQHRPDGLGPRVENGRLRCGRCGGRAIVEWDPER
jgi:hypothetical protein